MGRKSEAAFSKLRKAVGRPRIPKKIKAVVNRRLSLTDKYNIIFLRYGSLDNFDQKM